MIHRLIYVSLVTAFTQPCLGASYNLTAQLKAVAKTSDGQVGICIAAVKGGAKYCVNETQKFSLQSIMKLIVSAAVLYQVDKQQLKLSDLIEVTPRDASPGPQDFADQVRKKGGLKTTVSQLIEYAITDSDSTSIDVLIARLGGLGFVREFIKTKQLVGMRIDRDERHLQAETQGLEWHDAYADYNIFQQAILKVAPAVRDEAWAKYLHDDRDTATPDGIIVFLQQLAQGTLLSPTSTTWLMEVMAKTNTGKLRLYSALPKGWKLAHKTGTSPTWKGMAAAVNDVGFITSPSGQTIAIAVFVAASKRSSNEREAIIAEAAKLRSSG